MSRDDPERSRWTIDEKLNPIQVPHLTALLEQSACSGKFSFWQTVEIASAAHLNLWPKLSNFHQLFIHSFFIYSNSRRTWPDLNIRLIHRPYISPGARTFRHQKIKLIQIWIEINASHIFWLRNEFNWRKANFSFPDRHGLTDGRRMHPATWMGIEMLSFCHVLFVTRRKA